MTKTRNACRNSGNGPIRSFLSPISIKYAFKDTCCVLLTKEKKSSFVRRDSLQPASNSQGHVRMYSSSGSELSLEHLPLPQPLLL